VLPEAGIERVGGADRYATSAMLVERLWADTAAVFHATGADWPDALSASSAAAEKDSPVLLVRATCTPASVRQVLRIITPAAEYIVGGASVVAGTASRSDC
jgi:putative cell wall-binding protein